MAEQKTAAGARAAATSNSFAQGSNPNAGNVLTDRLTTSVRCAPGGNSSLCLGSDDSSASFPAAVPAPQQQPQQPAEAGAALPAAGERVKGSSNGFAQGSNPNAGNSLSERPSTAVRYAPGGYSSLCLGADDAAPAPAPVASSSSSNAFAQGANPNSGNVLTERPTTAVRCAPGGASTLVLGAEPAEAAFVRGAAPTRVSAEATAAALAEAPALARTAPGGASNLVLGASDADLITTPGVHTRVAPGGASTVVLGADGAAEAFQRGSAPHLNSDLALTAATAQAHALAPEQRVAPGGTSSVVLGLSEEEIVEMMTQKRDDRVAPGGASTVVLGMSSAEEAFDRSAAPTRTSSAAAVAAAVQAHNEALEQRVAPGGTSTVHLGAAPAEVAFKRDDAPGNVSKDVLNACAEQAHSEAPEQRVLPGGAATVLLGETPAKESFLRDDAPTRASSEVAASAAADACVMPGGAATVCLGALSAKELFQRDDAPTRVSEDAVVAAAVAAHAAAPVSRVAPGGVSTLVLGGDALPAIQPSGRVAPGGASTLMKLGDETAQDAFFRSDAPTRSSVAAATAAAVLAHDSAPDGRVAPGGASTVLLGDYTITQGKESSKIGQGTADVENNPNVANLEAAGKFLDAKDITLRPRAAPPGGAATVVLG